METVSLLFHWAGANEASIRGWLAIAGAIAAVGWAAYQLAENRDWKKAELAQKILGEIFADPRCTAAMRMVDWNRYFALQPPDEREHVRIARQDVIDALRVDGSLVFTPEELLVRDSFDALLDALQRLEHYLETKLLDQKDVSYPLRYTVEELTAPPLRAALERYIEHYKFDHAAAFLSRYPFWAQGEDRSRAQCMEQERPEHWKGGGRVIGEAAVS